ISWQTDVGRRNFFRLAQAVNAVLQPVFGNVAVNERIRSDSWKTKNKEQPQRNPSENCKEQVAEILAHELAHAANITRFVAIATSATHAARIASNSLTCHLNLPQHKLRMEMALSIWHTNMSFTLPG